MTVKHIAYRIVPNVDGLVCTHSQFEEDKMLDLLYEIQQSQCEGLYWVFKQPDNQTREPLCIIDCQNNRIYYHFSGNVEAISNVIQKLNSNHN